MQIVNDDLTLKSHTARIITDYYWTTEWRQWLCLNDELT